MHGLLVVDCDAQVLLDLESRKPDRVTLVLHATCSFCSWRACGPEPDSSTYVRIFGNINVRQVTTRWSPQTSGDAMSCPSARDPRKSGVPRSRTTLVRPVLPPQPPLLDADKHPIGMRSIDGDCASGRWTHFREALIASPEDGEGLHEPFHAS